MPPRPSVYSCGRKGRYAHRVPMLTTRFRYANQGVLSGKARFYGDRIELTGWFADGRHGHRCIRLDEIASMTYHPLQDDANLTLHLMGGGVLRLHVRQAHLWRERYENWVRYDVLPSAKLLSGMDEVIALAG